MTPPQALGIAAIQGATELFPVSSLGHAVIVPWLFGWRFDQQSSELLPFLVMLHAGTAVALLAYFWRDWWDLATSILGLGTPKMISSSRRLAWLIVVATIPAVVIGGLLEHTLRRIFVSPALVAALLIGNGLMLVAGDRLRSRQPACSQGKLLTTMTARDALAIGCWQCLALLPGLSRSGATMVGGLLRGIDHADSAHFSFLIAFPVICAASVLEIPKLLRVSPQSGVVGLAEVSAILAGVVAFSSTAFLMRYFQRHDQQALRPFAIYCVVAGGLCLAYAQTVVRF